MECPYCTSLRTPQIPGVRFKEIPDWPHYLVGDDGHVYSAKNARWGERLIWRRLKPSTAPSGHQGLRLSRRDPVATKTVLIHSLVLTAFVGPRPPKMDACHFDGDPKNNALSNLRWDTRKANVADARRHGTLPMGEKSHASRLTVKQVMEMRQLHAEGMGYKRLGKRFGVTQTTAYNAVSGKSWKHVKAHGAAG